MRALRLTFSALLGLMVAACIPEFANPLTGGNPADPAITGAWTGKAKDDNAEIAVDITASGDGVSLVMHEPGGDVGEDTITFKGVTAAVGGVSYISLKPVGDDLGGTPGFMIFRYELKDGKISVWTLDEQAMGAAIEKGPIKGTVTGSGTDTAPKISATSDEIAAFLATPEGKAAFKTGESDVLILTRATR